MESTVERSFCLSKTRTFSEGGSDTLFLKVDRPNRSEQDVYTNIMGLEIDIEIPPATGLIVAGADVTNDPDPDPLPLPEGLGIQSYKIWISLMSMGLSLSL